MTMLNDIDLPTEPLRELVVITAYLTDEDRVALLVFCDERNIPIASIED